MNDPSILPLALGRVRIFASRVTPRLWLTVSHVIRHAQERDHSHSRRMMAASFHENLVTGDAAFLLGLENIDCGSADPIGVKTHVDGVILAGGACYVGRRSVRSATNGGQGRGRRGLPGSCSTELTRNARERREYFRVSGPHSIMRAHAAFLYRQRAYREMLSYRKAEAYVT